MKAVASYPGSFGEMLQGRFEGKEVLLSCPINLFTKATLFESNSPKFKYNNPKSMQFLKSILKEWDYESYDKNIDIHISSKLPKGKGYASSTADLCAVYHAMLKLFNKQYNEEELVKACIDIEPTDSIIFKKMTVFDYKKGEFKENIGEYFKFYLLVFEGSKTVNTIEFNNKKLEPLSEIEDLISIYKNGLLNNSVKELAMATTESIIRNQARLKYDVLGQVIKIKNLTGGLGIIGAHSGDALAVIYDDKGAVDIALKGVQQLHNYKTYKLEAIDKIEINNYINFY